MYEVIHIKGDGACLFNAVATGILKASRPPGWVVDQREVYALSGELRQKAVDLMEQTAAQNINYKTSVGVTFINDYGTNKKLDLNVAFERYIKKMRKHKTWGGHIETMMLNNIVRTDYKKFFRGGLVVHQQNTNGNNHYYTQILPHMTNASACNMDDGKIRLHVILEDVESGGSHFNLLWPVENNKTKSKKTPLLANVSIVKCQMSNDT